MAKNIQAGENFWKRVIKTLRDDKKIELGLDEDDMGDTEAIELVVLTATEVAADILGENKSENEDVTFEIPEYITLKCGYRDGEGGGNFGIGATIGSELKKRVKDDAFDSLLND